jgi:hypothetical protein
VLWNGVRLTTETLPEQLPEQRSYYSYMIYA